MKEETIERIKQRILDEQRKHPTLDWAFLAAVKIYGTHFGVKPLPRKLLLRSEIITLLEAYSNFLEQSGHTDIDWRTEEPYAIDEFLRLHPAEEQTPQSVETETLERRIMNLETLCKLAEVPDTVIHTFSKAEINEDDISWAKKHIKK